MTPGPEFSDASYYGEGHGCRIDTDLGDAGLLRVQQQTMPKITTCFKNLQDPGNP
jgi:hypothetical protein